MDYFNLSTEYNSLTSYTKNGIQSLSNFLSFLKNIYKYSEQFVLNSKSSLDQFITQFLNEDTNTTLSIHCFEFYKALNCHFTTMINQNNKLHNELIEPLKEYIAHITNQNNNTLNELKEIMNEINSQKKKFDQAKKNYFDSSKVAEEQEKSVIQSIENKEQNKGTDEEISKAHEILVNLRTKSEENCQLYKNELIKTNKLYEEKNKQYFPLLEIFKNNEESRISYFKFHFIKMNRIYNNVLQSSNEMYSKINDTITEIIPEADIKYFGEKFNFANKIDERIPKEEFENYDIYRRNLEAMNKKNQMMLQKENKNSLLPSTEEMILPQDKGQGNGYSYSFSKEELRVVEGLFEEADVNNVDFENLNKKMSIVSYCTNFVDKLLEKYKNVLRVQIPNENNFERLSTILLSIVKNEILQQTIFEINFAIAYISEKTFYQSEKNPFYKIYLCKILSEKNPIFREKEFWQRLLELKLETDLVLKAKRLAKAEINKEKKQQQKKEEAKQITPQAVGMMGLNAIKSVMSITGIFNRDKEAKEKALQDKKFVEMYNKIQYEEPLRVIRDFITHFSCFNLDSSEVVDILTETASKYKFDSEQDKLKFIISVINSNMYSIKNSKFYSKKENLRVLENTELTIPLTSHTFMNKNYLKHQKNKDNNIGIILNCFKYLEPKDYINLLVLNKKYYSVLSKILYKNYLLNKPISLETRIKIWKQILKFDKNKNNYTETKEKISKEELPIFETINMDVIRTKFTTDNENNKKKTYNILCCVALNHPKINYCQGMNYIAAFLLTYTKSEEEAYNIFNYLLETTDYSDLFANELKRLSKYFYVFDRLIYIYLPEVFSYLKTQNLSVTYYISPWFITLFTNALNHINELNNPKVLIWIFDLFIVEGWKAVIKIGLCLMKHFENKILGLKYDELLHFLVNDILKYDFFQNNNYEKLRKIYFSLKIESGLIENIEKEYEINESMMKNEKK